MSLFLHLQRALKEFGVRGTIAKMYAQGEVKFGTLIGVDKMGNRYYENLEYPFGQHRWVEYADIHNFDASMVPPEWHGWIHHTYDEPPTVAARKPELEATAASVNTPYDHHVGHVSEGYVPGNMHVKTQHRSRGYGMGNAPLYHEDGDDEDYFLHKSHPLNTVKQAAEAAKKAKK